MKREIRDFVDEQIKSKQGLNYSRLSQIVTRKYGVKLSKATFSKRAKALNLRFARGRKRTSSVGKRPAHSTFLDCAGAFFLKGAELEMGLLAAINRFLATSSESKQARRALKLAQQINALLLYAPVFELKAARDIADYQRGGLLYLAEQKGLPLQQIARQAGIPRQTEMEQYLRFLTEQKLLLFIIKEVAEVCVEALFVHFDLAGRGFYLDAQSRTVWPNSKIPQYFSATLSKTKGYVESIFQSPSPQRPLILQACPGYTFLPPEMFNLIQCLEKAEVEPISRIVIADKSVKSLHFWHNLQPPQRCFFIAPLSPWQYAKLQGTRIVKDFQQYHLGPEKEAMAVADAEIYLFNPQLNRNIRVRAALVRRKAERLALITNISRRQERYIRKIAEQYFSRWPDKKLKTHYDLLEEAQEEALARSRSRVHLTPFLAMGYSQRPQDAFHLFLEHLHRYALSHFFPAEYEKEDLKSMREKFYRQKGFLKIKRNLWELILRPFPQKKLQEDAQLACQKFNQSGIKFPDQKCLRICLQEKQ